VDNDVAVAVDAAFIVAFTHAVAAAFIVVFD
jgi:hypothetical protein